MKSLGIFKMKVPSTGFFITAEKFSIRGNIFFSASGNVYGEKELEVVEEISDGKKIPVPASLPWS